MCGICGYYSKNSLSLEHLSRMNDTMIHRGPDDYGVESYILSNDYYVGLAHRRLSIIDLSVRGHQPMKSKDGRICVVFNGEIYNYNELKKELPDYQFISRCDTEVIIAAYEKWGISFVNKLNGMYAIAILDCSKQSLFLVRDRMGKKPLFFWNSEHGIVFSSELKPIIAHPKFNKKIRKDILLRYIYNQYICEPDTIFEDVYKLEHGCILTIKGKVIKKEKYWDVVKEYGLGKDGIIRDYGEAKYLLCESIKKAVCRRMISDVPVGVLLSGGYDSSIVAAMAQEFLGKSRLKTFTVGFYEKEFNEADSAKRIAQYLNTEHTEYYCSEDEMCTAIDDLPIYFDEPFADPSEIPTMLVSKLARETVTVALSGDGGDELFCGYNVYDLVRRAQYLWIPATIIARVGSLCGIYDSLPRLVKLLGKGNNRKNRSQLIKSDIKDSLSRIINTKELLPPWAINDDEIRVRNWQERRMLIDMETYLPSDILTKIDRSSMRYSLECRSPILDCNVVRQAFKTDFSFKYNDGSKKKILKDITHDYLPSDIMDRPKKGFGAPIDKWLKGRLRDRLIDYTNLEYVRRQGIFCAEELSNLTQKYIDNSKTWVDERIMWSIFVFQQWYEFYCL